MRTSLERRSPWDPSCRRPLRLIVTPEAQAVGNPIEIGIEGFGAWPSAPVSFEFAAGDLALLLDQAKGANVTVSMSVDLRTVHVVRQQSIRQQGANSIVQCSKQLTVMGVRCSPLQLPEVGPSMFDRLMDEL